MRASIYWCKDILFMFVIISIITSSCAEPKNPANDVGKMDVPTVHARPTYIKEIAPEEYFVIPYALYNKEPPPEIIAVGPGSVEEGFRSNLCLEIDLKLLVQKGDNLSNFEQISPHLKLFVDGQEITDFGTSLFRSTLAYADFEVENDFQTAQTRWITGTNFCWIVPLTPGTHEALFQFHQTSGDVQEYRWQFEISE